MLSVAILGAGQLGSGVAAILRERATHHVLGPFGRAARERALGSGADVVLIATTTRFRDVAPDIEAAVRAGSDVLVSAEECAYPFAVDASLAARLALGNPTAFVNALAPNGKTGDWVLDPLSIEVKSPDAVPAKIVGGAVAATATAYTGGVKVLPFAGAAVKATPSVVVKSPTVDPT